MSDSPESRESKSTLEHIAEAALQGMRIAIVQTRRGPAWTANSPESRESESTPDPTPLSALVVSEPHLDWLAND